MNECASHISCRRIPIRCQQDIIHDFWLLFHSAVRVVERDHRPVVFITSDSRNSDLLEKSPFLPQYRSEQLSQIGIRYLCSTDVVEWLSYIHCMLPLPSTIFIHRMSNISGFDIYSMCMSLLFSLPHDIGIFMSDMISNANLAMESVKFESICTISCPNLGKYTSEQNESSDYMQMDVWPSQLQLNVDFRLQTVNIVPENHDDTEHTHIS